jgi:hypothetical protein
MSMGARESKKRAKTPNQLHLPNIPSIPPQTLHQCWNWSPALMLGGSDMAIKEDSPRLSCCFLLGLVIEIPYPHHAKLDISPSIR